MLYSNLLDICVGDHSHDWERYYGLAETSHGVDISPNRRGLDDCDEISLLDVNKKLPFSDLSFDFVLSDHTIEHLENPLGFYQEIQRVFSRHAVIKLPQGWSDRIFRRRGDHKYQFKKTWFYENLKPGISITTQTNFRPGFPYPSWEIEVHLRKF